MITFFISMHIVAVIMNWKKNFISINSYLKGMKELNARRLTPMHLYIYKNVVSFHIKIYEYIFLRFIPQHKNLYKFCRCRLCGIMANIELVALFIVLLCNVLYSAVAMFQFAWHHSIGNVLFRLEIVSSQRIFIIRQYRSLASTWLTSFYVCVLQHSIVFRNLWQL